MTPQTRSIVAPTFILAFILAFTLTAVSASADMAPSPKFDCPNIARLEGSEALEFFDALPMKAVEKKDGDITLLTKEVKTARGTLLLCLKILDKAGKSVDYFRSLKPHCYFESAKPNKH